MNAARSLLWVALAIVLSFGACTSEVQDIPATTQVTLRLSSDASVLSRVDKVRLSLWLQDASGWRAGSSSEVAVDKRDWPLDVPVLPKNSADQNATFEVLIEAFSGGTSVLRTRVVARFVANKLVVVSASLAPCSAPGLTCDGDSCHGPDCTTCNGGSACTRAGVTAPDVTIDTTAPDGGSSPDTGPSRGDASSAPGASLSDGGSSTGTNAGRDGSLPTTVDPTADGAVPTGVDGGALAPDSGAPTPAACPAPNVCNALLYPCVPTPAGYTCQGQFADWPMPDGVTGAKFAPSFTSTGETALDNVTKLEWQLGLPNTYPGCTSRKQLANGVQGTYAEWCTREEGIKYCAELVRGTHDDWRLPSLIELTSLFDMRDPPASANAIDLNFFGDSTSQDFISRSTGAGAPSKTWLVSYEFREIILFNNLSGRVRCVRGGAAPGFATPADRYLVGADTVTDRATTLVWQRSFSTKPIDEGGAEAYCAALGVGFRVPTSNELMTLVDTTRSAPAIDTTAFPNTPSEAFALPSKTLVRESSVAFDTGMLRVSSTAPSYVRCVRNQ
ncbi:MAG: hypothetical protein RLZZ450_260 [Pseudomonadota bacterium]|jgi:hypothetical protein